MKVLYDHQIFAAQNFGGISRYFVELLRGQAGSVHLAAAYSDNEYLLAEPNIAGTVRPKSSLVRPSPLYRMFNRRQTRRPVLIESANQKAAITAIVAGQWSIFHPTYYDPYFLDWIGPRPFVLTVHDMIHELFPEYFSVDDPTARRKKLLVDRAAHIIAISECTKQDLIELYGVPASRISVVYHGGSLKIVDAIENSVNLPARFMLLVGTRGGYKNVYFAIRALRELLLSQPDLSLICAGGGGFSTAEVEFIKDLDLTGRVLYYPASDAMLALLYREASAFVFPSLYEGFGIPLLEAFACGCPVVASDTPALREIAGDAAEYFDPKSVNAIRSAVMKILDSDEVRSQLRVRGRERLRRYSWERCVSETRAVYESILSAG